MEKKYSSKQAAKKGMWNYYQKYAPAGRPLIGDNGLTLQWTTSDAVTKFVGVDRLPDDTCDTWIIKTNNEE